MFAEVHLSRGFDTGRSMAVVDAVQVELEDLPLAVALVEGGGQQQLSQLGQPGAVGRVEDGDLGQLFFDGARPLLRPARDHVDQQRLGHPGPVDAAVLIEVAVLGRDRRLLERRTDVAQMHRSDPGALGVALLDQGPVPVDEGNRAGGEVEA